MIILWGMTAFVSFALCFIKNKKTNIFILLSECAFFIYCYHSTIALFLKKVALKFVCFDNVLLSNFVLMFIYILIVMLITVFGYYIYVLMNKYSPKVLSILMGYR